jgi:hypothetical protein
LWSLRNVLVVERKAQKANCSLENPFAIMLAQLKTVLLIKEAMKLAFFRLV